MAHLTPLGPDLWHLESHFGSAFPIRMTVRRTDEGLVLWSPVALDDEVASELEALGPVRTIVAPNLFHYAFVGAAKERFPDAQVLAPRALRTKRPKVPIDAELYAGLDLGSACVVHAVEGSEMVSEFVLHDPEQDTLIVTDLVFNVLRAHSFASWIVFRVFAGTMGGLRQSRLWRTFVKDKEAAGASMEAISALPFERLIVAHGEIINNGGQEYLRNALARWIA